MGTAGEEGGRAAAAAGKGCPSNRAGSIQEASPTPRCKMIVFMQLLQHKRARGALVWPGEREAHTGRGGGPCCQLQPSTFQRRKGRKENSSLNLLAYVNHKNHPFNTSPFVGREGNRLPSVHQLMKQYARKEGRNPKHCNFMGALNSPCSGSFIHTGDKDHLLPIYWKLFFFSQLELLKCCELPLPKLPSDTCWMGQAQLCSSTGSAHTVTLHGFLLFICVTSLLW